MFVLVVALQRNLVFQPFPDPTVLSVSFVGEFLETVETLIKDFVDGRVERGEPHVLDDDGAARELERGPAEHFRVVVGRRDLLSEPHRLRRVARVVRVVEEAGADRLRCGGAAEGRALESSHGVNGGGVESRAHQICSRPCFLQGAGHRAKISRRAVFVA